MLNDIVPSQVRPSTYSNDDSTQVQEYDNMIMYANHPYSVMDYNVQVVAGVVKTTSEDMYKDLSHRVKEQDFIKPLQLRLILLGQPRKTGHKASKAKSSVPVPAQTAKYHLPPMSIPKANIKGQGK